MPADYEEIREVHVASIHGVEDSPYNDEELEVWASGVSATSYSLDDPETVVLVAESDGDIVGFVEASITEAELDKLYVDSAYQHQGIATSLSEELDQYLRSQGVDSVFVEAAANAIPFYERVGYERVGTHMKPISSDGTSVEMKVIDMEKKIRLRGTSTE
ncbi:GNAT family N-acetyltransferase [Natronoglomus mannanivorans]|uniref:GNAT family N-acetyltransferase n=1 Tax=Natronoglomus mannanivorans TaxID=2979990 RepID=A0AAP2Z4E9_9EURY|nr:GNAT family N-acetyltransferase [Halobacteria archaeon AArc-xg1-1]